MHIDPRYGEPDLREHPPRDLHRRRTGAGSRRSTGPPSRSPAGVGRGHGPALPRGLPSNHCEKACFLRHSIEDGETHRDQEVRIIRRDGSEHPGRRSAPRRCATTTATSSAAWRCSAISPTVEALRRQIKASLHLRGHRHQERGHAGRARAAAPGRQEQQHRADRGRAGHRQGAGGAGDPQPGAAQRRARSSRSTAAPSPTPWSSPSCSATCAAPSPTPRATGRAASPWPRAAPCCSTRSASSRPRCRSSCCACCRSGSTRRWAASAPVKADVRILAATNRDLALEVAQRPLPPGPLLPAQRGAHRRCRRCAPAPRTSRCWSSTSSQRFNALQGRRITRHLRPGDGLPDGLPLSRATCASWRTPSSTPSSSAPATRSSSRTCRPTSVEQSAAAPTAPARRRRQPRPAGERRGGGDPRGALAQRREPDAAPPRTWGSPATRCGAR